MRTAPTRERIEAPECRLGYPEGQLKRVLGDRYDEFCRWGAGQTGAICEGRAWNPETKAYQPSHCGPHGPVTYQTDVLTFLAGGRQLD